MITFEELKEKTTPEIIKEMVELTEGFTYELYKDKSLSGIYYNKEFLFYLEVVADNIFPLLLHRAVEGWNKIQGIGQSGNIFINDDGVFINNSEPICYLFKNYLPCHLTACEMAIWDCLLNIL